MGITQRLKESLARLRRQVTSLTEEQSNAQRTIKELQHEIKVRKERNLELAAMISANNDWINRPNTGAVATIERLQLRISEIDKDLREIAKEIEDIEKDNG